jgi:hypothetical protein
MKKTKIKNSRGKIKTGKFFWALLFLCGISSIFFIRGSEAASTFTVCSAGCDFSSIQKIFDEVDLEPGDVVEVQADSPGGTKIYRETVSLGADDEGSETAALIFRSRPGDTVIIDGGTANDTAVSVERDYVVLENFKITGSKEVGLGISGKRVKVNRVEVYGIGSEGVSSGHGFYVFNWDPNDTADQIELNDCLSHDNAGAGFHQVHYVSNITYNNCESYRNGRYVPAHGFSGHPERQTFIDGWSLEREDLGEEIFANGDMELDAVWQNYGTSVLHTRSSERVHGGTYSWKVEGDGGWDGSFQNFFRESGKLYKISVWVYPVNLDAILLAVQKNEGEGYAFIERINELVPNSWNHIERYFEETHSGSQSFSIFTDQPGIFYFDDASVKEVVQGPVFSRAYLLPGDRVEDDFENISLVYNHAGTLIGKNEWDVDGEKLFVNLGNDPNGKKIIVTGGTHGPAVYNNCSSYDNFDSIFAISGGIIWAGEGHGFAADDLASGYSYFGCRAFRNQGHGFSFNRGRNNLVVNSLIYRNAQMGFYASTNASAELYNNTFYANADGAGCGKNSSLTLKNNIFSASSHFGVWSDGCFLMEDFNGYYFNSAGDRNSEDAGSHSLFGDPLFMDILADDFRLKAVSPMINAGTVIPGFSEDILGVSRSVDNWDIGAYEWSGDDNMAPNAPTGLFVK